jgi:hypothetical protein
MAKRIASTIFASKQPPLIEESLHSKPTVCFDVAAERLSDCLERPFKLQFACDAWPRGAREFPTTLTVPEI